jgi:hypothetical protein
MILFPTGVQGIADTRWQGAQGQAHRIVGVDYRSEPGLIKVQQKLTKDSPETGDNAMTELCKVAIPVSDGSTLWFSSESGKIWREVDGTYTLITTFTIPGYTFSLKTAQDSGLFKNVTTQVNIPYGICFKTDGTKMYILCNATVSGNNGEIFEYDLSTPFDISTATYNSKTYTGIDINGRGLAIKSDGTKIFVCEDGGGTSVIAYTLSTPWDISTASAAGETFNFTAQGSSGYAVNFKDDGLKMYVFFQTGLVSEYTLSSAWNVTTASHTATFNFGAGILGGCISPSGDRIYKQESDSQATITEYFLTTAWDVSTAVLTGETFPAGTARYFALSAFPDGSGFVTATQDTVVYQYNVTDATEDLNVTVLGAEEYGVFDGPDGSDEDTDDDELKQYVYFATKNWLFRIAVSDIGNANWETTSISNVEYLTLFKNSDDTYHPFKKQNNRLFVGDRYCLLEVNEFGVITLETDFNVMEPERITTLGRIDVDLLIGTKERDKAWVKRWDTEALSWYAEDSVKETEIYAFLEDDNYVYVIAGDYGRGYFYDGEKMLPDFRVPGQYNKNARSKVNQNAVASFMGIPVFGFSNITGNPAWQGVYAYGRYSKDYNVTMDLSFPLSCHMFSDIEIGAIIVNGFDLMISFKSETAGVGVDRIDWTAKYESAFIESMVLLGPADRARLKNVDMIKADYYNLPENTGLEFSFSNNYQGFDDLEPQQKVNEKLYQVHAKATQPEVGAAQVMFEFNVDGNNGPEVENFHVKFVGEEA